MDRFTEPAVMIRCGNGPAGERRRRAYHAAADRAGQTLNQWARQALDAAAHGLRIHLPVDDPPDEFCEE